MRAGIHTGVKQVRGGAVALCLAIVGLVIAGCGDLTGPKSPSTPANVLAVVLTSTSVRVTWTPSPLSDGVISYSVYRNGTKVGESTTTEFTDTGLAESTEYQYSVAANCVSGVISEQSPVTSQSTVITTDQTAPRVVSVVPLNGATGASLAANVVVTFSEPMDPATINTTTFTLRVTGGAAIGGTVVYNPAARTATFTPVPALPNGANITVNVSAGARDLAGNGLNPVFTSTFSTRDEVPPTVQSTSPANGGTISATTPVSVTFSEPMDPATINATNITVRFTSTGAAVPGSVAYNATTLTATFTPTSPFTQGANFTVTVAAAVRDVAGNQMGTAFQFTFSVADTTPPTVTGVSPTSGATNVSVSTVVTVTFSEAMDASTITGANILLRTTIGSVPVAGAVSYNAGTNTATFTPTAPLAFATGYTVVVTTGVRDVAGNALAAQFTSSFTTVVAPVVVSTVPANGAAGVSTSAAVSATFSKPLDPATVTSTTFTLRLTSSGAAVTGVVTYNAATNTAVFTPSAPLLSGAAYTATVTTGIRDLAGNALQADHVWTFVTVDNVPPAVVSVTPVSGATNVATNTAVTIVFSEPMDAATINTTNITLRTTATSVNVPGTVAFNAGTNTATFTPNSVLGFGTGYTVEVSTGVRDLAGNAMAATFNSTFTTAAAPDVTPPTVTGVSPAAGATNVSVSTVVTVTFSEAMDATTINSTNILLRTTIGSVPVAGAVSYNAGTNTATFTPTAPLAFATGYTVVVTTGVRDVAGNALAAEFTSSFTTEVAPGVSSITPASGAASVPTNTTVVIIFNKPMDASTITAANITLRVTAGMVLVPWTLTSFSAATNTATFTPNALLSVATGHTVTVTTAVRDAGGNALPAPFVSTFTTESAPGVSSTSPVAGATGVAVGANVLVTFTKAMSAATITSGTNFFIRQINDASADVGGNIAAAITYDAGTITATLNPTPTLLADTRYRVTVTTGVQDTSGNPLPANFVFIFRTAP